MNVTYSRLDMDGDLLRQDLQCVNIPGVNEWKQPVSEGVCDGVYVKVGIGIKEGNGSFVPVQTNLDSLELRLLFQSGYGRLRESCECSVIKS